MKLQGDSQVSFHPHMQVPPSIGATDASGDTLTMSTGEVWEYDEGTDAYWRQDPGNPPGSWFKLMVSPGGDEMEHYDIYEYTPQNPRNAIHVETGALTQAHAG